MLKIDSRIIFLFTNQRLLIFAQEPVEFVFFNKLFCKIFFSRYLIKMSCELMGLKKNSYQYDRTGCEVKMVFICIYN